MNQHIYSLLNITTKMIHYAKGMPQKHFPAWCKNQEEATKKQIMIITFWRLLFSKVSYPRSTRTLSTLWHKHRSFKTLRKSLCAYILTLYITWSCTPCYLSAQWMRNSFQTPCLFSTGTVHNFELWHFNLSSYFIDVVNFGQNPEYMYFLILHTFAKFY